MTHPIAALCPLLLLALAGPARAQEGTDDKSDSSIDDLLNSIPTVENPAGTDPEAEEEPAGPDVPFTRYVDEVRAQVLAAWKPKGGLVRKNPSLETRLVLVIDEQGQVQALKPMVLSGEKKFDQDAVDAVNDAGDLPAPAANLRTLAQEGVVVIFSARAWLEAR